MKVKPTYQELQEENKILRKYFPEKMKISELILLKNIMHSNTEISIAATDIDLNLIYFNKKAEQIFGYNAKDVIGKNLTEIHQMNKVGFLRIENAIETIKKQNRYEYFVTTNENDEIKQYKSIINGIWDDAKTLDGFVLFTEDITEQKKAEETLKNSEERLKILFESAPNPYYLADQKGYFIDGNKAAENLLGYKKEELIGKSFLKLKILSAKQILHASKLLLKNIQGKRTGPDEFILKRKDESQVYTEMHTYPVKIKNKTVILGIAHDITERKQAENNLRIQHELALITSGSNSLNFIMESLLALSMQLDSIDCVGIYLVNELTGAIDLKYHRGFTKEFVHSASFFDVNSPNVKLINKGKPIYYNYSEILLQKEDDIRKKEGLKATAIIPIIFKKKTIAVLNVASLKYEEISENSRLILESLSAQLGSAIIRTQTIEKLTSSEENYRHLFEESPLSLVKEDWSGVKKLLEKKKKEEISISKEYFDKNPDFFNSCISAIKILDINKKTLELLKFKSKDKFIRNYKMIFNAKSLITLKNELNAIANDEKSFSEESELVDAKGKTLSVIIKYQIVGDYKNILFSIIDISEQKQAEKLMLKTSRMEVTATLAAGVAHDFNNLMVGVLGNADLLRMQYDKNSDVFKKLKNIADNATKAGELSQKLLAFARGGKYHPQILNINTIVKDTLSLNKHSFPPRINLTINIEPELLNINADSSQMTQVLMNLCINSVESIKNNGNIIIKTYNIDIDKEFAVSHPPLKEGNHICLTVEDTGSGMHKDILPKIFEPFFSTKSTGRGLGMAAVFGIIENHDGYISIESEFGKGTVINVYIPAIKLDEKRNKILSDKKSKKRISAEALTILIIDDEEMVLDVSKQFLEIHGYKTILANNGQEAVNIAQNYDNDIHLALLDMGMPVMGGQETFPLLKKARPELKVIICSGYELDSAAQLLLDSGANAFLQKPFRLKSLTQKVHEVLDIN